MPVANIMRRTRAIHHYNVGRAKSHVYDISRQRFAEAVLRDDARDFWSEVRHIARNRTMQSNVVDGLSSPKAVSEIFADKYKNLYNSPLYNAEHMQMLRNDIGNSVVQDGYSRDYVVCNSEVSAVILQLKPKKDGSNSSSTNHFKHAGADLSVQTACLFSRPLVHGTFPNDF
jgi:hypothetical protein